MEEQKVVDIVESAISDHALVYKRGTVIMDAYDMQREEGMVLKSPKNELAWGANTEKMCICVETNTVPFMFSVMKWVKPAGEGDGRMEKLYFAEASTVHELCFQLGLAIAWIKTVYALNNQNFQFPLAPLS